MAMTRRKFKPRIQGQENPRRQIVEMKRLFPQFAFRMKRGDLIWSGTLHPTPESQEYSVRIVHIPGITPRVFVDDPDIHPRAPHRYREGNLCLFWSKEWKWHRKESLAETLVPWAAMWLYYYEIWQFCGEWMGPSSPHGEFPKQADEDSLQEDDEIHSMENNDPEDSHLREDRESG